MFNETSGETVTIGPENNQITVTIPVTLLKFDSLVLTIMGNSIEAFDSRIFRSNDVKAWMNGLVEQFGCDAILCPVGFWTGTGRQEKEMAPCKECTDPSKFMGATTCVSVDTTPNDLDQLEILAKFYLMLEGPKWN